MGSDSISTTETAKLVRGDLQKHFPTIKFSVQSKKYAGGSSIDVSWGSGPTSKQVEDIAGKYHGSTFNPMEDITEHIHGSPYQNHYIFFHRDLPDATVKAEMVALAQKYQFPDSLVENPDRYDEKMAEKLGAIFQRDVRSLREGAWASLGQKDLTTGKESPRSIIKDYTKLRDWELDELAKKGYPAAIEEKRWRGLKMSEVQEAPAPKINPKRKQYIQQHRSRYTNRKPRLSR
jgi:hypothetical protein